MPAGGLDPRRRVKPYGLEQFTGFEWEPLPGPGYGTQEIARAVMQAAEQRLGWRDMRIVESLPGSAPRPVEYGIESE
jgi:hypothetical protein